MQTNFFGYRLRNITILTVAIFFLAGTANAQEEKPADNAVAQANNPLANFTAINVHDYYIGELTELDKSANQAWVRFAKPFSIGKSNWIMRASLPINTYPVGQELDYKTGLSDLNVFAAYLINTGKPTLSFGIGPQITMPTATADELGSEKWSAGLVNTLFNFKSKKFQYGYLLSWQASFAGNDERADVNTGAFQPFLFYQLGHGNYLRSSAVAVYNFENSTYTVPLGLGFGRVLPSKKAVFNVFLEPQFSVADKGAGWPVWQLFFAVNTQLK